MEKLQFIKIVNDNRKQNKNKWSVQHILVNGLQVAIKSYNTWIQIFNVNGIKVDTGLMDISVKDYKEFLGNMYNNHLLGVKSK